MKPENGPNRVNIVPQYSSNKKRPGSIPPMPLDLQRGIEKLIENPTKGQPVRVIIEAPETDLDFVAERAEELGATIEKRIPNDSLAVSLDETDLERLCEIEPIVAIELDGKSKQLDAGNAHSPIDSSR